METISSGAPMNGRPRPKPLAISLGTPITVLCRHGTGRVIEQAFVTNVTLDRALSSVVKWVMDKREGATKMTTGCQINERHCENCGSTDREDLDSGDQGYTACCNELVSYGSSDCRNHHGEVTR